MWLQFFSRIILWPLSILLGPFRIFTKIRGGDYRNFVFISGVEEKLNHSTAKKAWSSRNHPLLSISLDLLLFSLLQRSNSSRSTVQLFLAPTLCPILSSYAVPQPWLKYKELDHQSLIGLLVHSCTQPNTPAFCLFLSIIKFPTMHSCSTRRGGAPWLHPSYQAYKSFNIEQLC